ncbi:MAG: RedB [Phycisphaerae bacterium]|nr:RedB [Phycisphaerae bacterium]
MTTEQPAPTSERPGPQTILAVVAWAVIVVGGFAALALYTHTGGQVSPPPTAERVPIELESDAFTLVMAIHPKCSCTDASLYELQRLARDLHDRVAFRFLVYVPSDAGDDWIIGAHRDIATTGVPGAVIDDPRGELASSMGMLTSGSVALFDPDGEPRFWGGITRSRGHAGDNLGSDAIRAIVRGDESETMTTTVYGCEIIGRTEFATAGGGER